MTPKESLEQFFTKAQVPEGAREAICHFVNKLEQFSCSGIVDKLNDYAAPGKLGDLIAELRMAATICAHTGRSVVLQGRDAADMRIPMNGFDCTIEIEHKSSPSSFAAVFCPTAEQLSTYESNNIDWQLAACRLRKTLDTLAIEVTPWIGQSLSESHWTYHARAAQEQLCGQVAIWLSQQLSVLPLSEACSIEYPGENVARFEIRPQQSAPALFRGHGSLEAYILNDYPQETAGPLSLSEWLANAVRKKAKIASKYPERRGSLHLIGLVVDEVIACRGDILANTCLGRLVARLQPGGAVEHYREAPMSARAALDLAGSRGRLDVLGDMPYRPYLDEKARSGLIFDSDIINYIDGVVALYYTDQLQFIPNIFSEREIALLDELFPRTLNPFSVHVNT